MSANVCKLQTLKKSLTRCNAKASPFVLINWNHILRDAQTLLKRASSIVAKVGPLHFSLHFARCDQYFRINSESLTEFINYVAYLTNLTILFFFFVFRYVVCFVEVKLRNVFYSNTESRVLFLVLFFDLAIKKGLSVK